MSGEPTIDVDAFWEDGYQIVRDVYTPDEIRAFREAAFASAGKGGDLLANPSLRAVLTDGRLVSIARQILGSGDLWYTGDSSFTINSGQRGFHKDNTDRTDANGPDWTNGRYTVLRFGVYLQDHEKHTGGLNLRAKSHNVVSLKKGQNIYVRTRVGDVGVWSLRTTHSGNGALVRWPTYAFPEPTEIASIPKWRIAKPDGDRLALFAAIGLNDAHHDRYVQYLKTRTYMVDSWNKSIYDEEALAEAAKVGLGVRDIRSEIQGDDTVGKNALWQPMPYPGSDKTTEPTA